MHRHDRSIPLADGSNTSYRRCSASCYQPIYHQQAYRLYSALSLSLSLSLHQALATVPRHYINGVLEVTLIELGVSSVIIARR